MKTYIVSHLGQEMGPYNESELKALWEKKQILPMDYIFDAEKEDWFVIADVFEWAQHLTSTSIPLAKKTEPLKAEEPPSLDKVERTLTNFAIKTDKTVKIQAKEDPPPPEIIFRRPKNMAYETQFSAGEARIDLSDLSKTPGSFVLKELPGSPIRFKEAFQIEVHPAVAKKISISTSASVLAGQAMNVKIEAVDENGHFCPTVDGSIGLSIHFENEVRLERVQILKGLGHFSFYHTRAEKIGFEISSTIENLEVGAMVYTQVQAGPATHMSVLGNKQFIAGQPIQLQLQAVDQFGNFVQSFSAKVDIEADKSASAKSSNKVG